MLDIVHISKSETGVSATQEMAGAGLNRLYYVLYKL